MEILFIIVALWLMNDAMNGYKAAWHAQKAVYPLCTIGKPL